MTLSDDIEQLPAGARWTKCALQVNPYSYLVNHHRDSASNYANETAYNEALVAELLAQHIEVIGIADHWSVTSGSSLRIAAEAAGLLVFPGFEATSHENVHLIVLFDPLESSESIGFRIGKCGIPHDCTDSRPGELTTIELLKEADEWGAVVIAPHVTTERGLLHTLKGQSAISAWCDSNLHAVGVSGAKLERASEQILKNLNPDYRREHPVAVLHSADVSAPSDLRKPSTSSWVKMSSRSIQGLDTAFRSPSTRVSIDKPPEHLNPILVGIGWDGGFLDETRIRLNDSFNVLIGGRGTGKSTMIESLRYALGINPVGDQARFEHESMIKSREVLGGGSRISVLVECRTPHVERFIIERSVPNPSVVRTADGMPSDHRVQDLIGGVEIYGQRELAELTRDKKKLTELLGRYLPRDDQNDEKLRTTLRNLKTSREQILKTVAEVGDLVEELNSLPGLQARLKQFDDAGVAQKLEAQDKVQTEEGVLDRVNDVFDSTADLAEEIRESKAEVDIVFEVDDDNELPNVGLLDEARIIVDKVNDAIEESAESLSAVLAVAITEFSSLRDRWSAASQTVRDGLDAILRDLQAAGNGADEYLSLRKRVSRLSPKRNDLQRKRRQLKELRSNRSDLLVEIEELRADRLRALKSMARRVDRSLKGVVQAVVADGEDRSPVTDLIAKHVSGRSDKIKAAIDGASLFSPREFADIVRLGRDEICKKYQAITAAQSDALVACGEELLMLLEEVELPVTTDLKLNVNPGGTPAWRRLEQLSTGQRATALLLLLLQGGTGPLVIDQPEDDLDNRFIFDTVVPKVRENKLTRQLIFSSHNANIPVLGDADQIVALHATELEGRMSGSIVPNAIGSLDNSAVRSQVEELLEGGKDAFETRRYLYGF